MNMEEIEELKEFTIDLTDIDELALGLEVCSKKSNTVIQEFADTIIQLQQENQKLKEVIDKAIKLIEDTYYSKNTTNIDSIILSSDKLLRIREILKEVNK